MEHDSPIKINLKSFYLGDKQADALSRSIEIASKLKVLELVSNQVSTKGFLMILDNVPETLEEINVSNNPQLGDQAYDALARILNYRTNPALGPDRKRKPQIRKLALEGNEIGDDNTNKLCSALREENYALTFLNLSKNCITDVGAGHIAKMLKWNETLTILLLHWNQIRHKGGLALAKTMSENYSLLSLDVSFNSIGNAKDNETAKALSRMFELNKSLLHMDMSHNNFTIEDMEIVSEG